MKQNKTPELLNLSFPELYHTNCSKSRKRLNLVCPLFAPMGLPVRGRLLSLLKSRTHIKKHLIEIGGCVHIDSCDFDQFCIVTVADRHPSLSLSLYIIGAQKLYTYSVLGGRTRAPPDLPIYMRGLGPPTLPFKSASGLPIYWF